MSLAFLLALLAAAEAPGSTRERLEPLAFLAGSCWTGTFPDGKSTDEHCFEWVFDGVFLRDRHVVRGERPDYRGETLYAWDPQRSRLRFWYWNSLGGVSEGVVEPGEEGLVFPERYESEEGVREMRSLWRRTGPDAYQALTLEKREGEWQELFRVAFTRAAAP